MLRAKESLVKLLCILCAGLILYICNFEVTSQAISSHFNAPYCGSICQPHSKAEKVGYAAEPSINEKEPIPPPASWISSNTQLLALYLVPLFAICLLVYKYSINIRFAVLRF